MAEERLLHVEIEQLKQEIARLRAALQEIAATDATYAGEYRYKGASRDLADCGEIAREALGETGGRET